jgi:hypothetical protein
MTPGGLCCLPQFYGGQIVSIDGGGACCPDAVKDPVTGDCCAASERDYLGACCPTVGLWHFGPVLLPNGTTVSNGCCQVDDCGGYCTFPNTTTTYTLDSNGTCCLTVDLDCNATCIPISGSPINVVKNGQCCPDSARDCTDVCYGPDLNCCSVFYNCTDCLAAQGCGWCGDPGVQSSTACYSGDFFGPTGSVIGTNAPTCASNWFYSSPSVISLQEGFFGANGQAPNIQPKRTVVVLAPGDPIKVPIQIRAPSNIPLDLFLVQDLTSSFTDDIKVFNATLPSFFAGVRAVVSDTWFGWGSFRDKPTDPFGYGRFGDYEYRTEATLSSDTTAMAAAYAALAGNPQGLIGGQDVPESSLDALLAVADQLNLRTTELGWRTVAQAGQNVNRIAVVITDAPPHTANDIPTLIAGGAYPCLSTIDTWVVNDNDGINSAGLRCDSAGQAATTKEGYRELYPLEVDVFNALNVKPVLPMFVVAPTTVADPTWGYREWALFAAQWGGRAVVTNLTSDSSNLVQAVTSALQQITQTLTLTVRSGSTGAPFINTLDSCQGTGLDSDPPVTPTCQLVYTNAAPGTVLNYTLNLVWDGNPSAPQPANISLDALFPYQGLVFDSAVVEIVVATPSSCGFCGDGIVQPLLGEQCEPLLDLAGCCDDTCFIRADQPCSNGLNLCANSVCSTTGECLPAGTVACINNLPDICSFNTCVPATGECKWQCRDGAGISSVCCDDNNPCTEDFCQGGKCMHTALAVCDCSVQNDCVSCVRVNVSCVWDQFVQKCMNSSALNNVTIDNKGNVIDPATGKPCSGKQCKKRYANTEPLLVSVCLPGGRAQANLGAIIGGTLGGACCLLVLLALIAGLVALRLAGHAPITVGEGLIPGEDLMQDNPLFETGGSGFNPLFQN